MCIIAYKPSNVQMPEYDTLKTMFEQNPDGSGFMLIRQNKVHIEKGFMDFKSFYKALKQYKSEWNKKPFVLHFRISTQAGVNKECCHPFPLCDNMAVLKKLKYDSDIGIAHNGIITLTSSYSKNVTHSDTMEFITDYLSLIIQTKDYYKHKQTLQLIERLAESKLAILDSKGHCELIGNFIKDNGVYYSNDTYKKRVYAQTYPKKTEKSKSYTAYCDYDYYDYYDYYDDYIDTFSDDEYAEFKKEIWDCYNPQLDMYEFDELTCPGTCYGVLEFCGKCVNHDKCFQ